MIPIRTSRSSIFFFAFALACSSMLAKPAEASGGPGNKTFGLGLQLGVPLGITGKAFFTHTVALQFGVGGVFPYAGLGAWLDVVFHFFHFGVQRDDLLKMSLYIGPGLQLGFAGPYYYAVHRGAGGLGTYSYAQGPLAIGLRVPFGFAIHWQKVTFDTFVEIAPVVYVVPGFYGGFEGAIGARYYF